MTRPYPQRRSKYADPADRVVGRIETEDHDGCWLTMPENSRRGCMRRWHGQDSWPRWGGQ